MGKEASIPENLPGKGGTEPVKGFEGENKLTQPDRSAFESFMEEKPGAPSGAAPEATKGVSPMDLAKQPQQPLATSLQTLGAQATTAQDALGEIQKNLQTPDLKFKRSQQYLLKNKLSDANDHLDSALKKLGLEPPPAQKLPSGADPVMKFLSYVTDGQNKLASAKSQLEKLNTEGKHLQPSQLLLIQVKLAQAQQEIEYCSVLLSKVVDVIKQTINIQI